MLENSEQKNNKPSRIAVLASVSMIVFLVACLFGEGLGGSLGSNPMCYKYLGCTTGFAGYDAIEHFLFGITAVFTLLWLFKKYSKYSLLHIERWKNILVIIALIMFVSVLWEFFEFSIDFFHLAFANWRLNINLLNQPTNIDTMGDMFFALMGSIATLLFTKKS